MFDFVRNHSKLMMGLLFLLIIPSFVLFGVEGYTRFQESGKPVAELDGQRITQTDWDAAHRREAERLRAQMPNMDSKLLDTPEARMATLEQLLNERVLAEAARKGLISVSDQRLARELQSIPQIAALRKPDGSLDVESYRQLAAAQGMTPEGFEASIRQDLSLRQVLGSVQDSAVSGQRQTELALDALLQRRQVQWQTFAPVSYEAKVKVSDEDLAKHHQDKSERFRSPEKVDVQYLVLDLAAVERQIRLPEADLRAYYEQNLQRLAGQEQRRARHILFNAPKDAPAADREKAKAAAQKVLDELRKQPKRFPELAKQHSQDSGSAARGGDLDFFARGAMVKPFEDAVFALKPNQIGDLVETEFGYHILEVTDVRAPKAPSFEAMRPQLEADLRRQQAQRQFAEAAETFTNSVYEQADSYQGVADKLKLTVEKATGVSRQGLDSVKALSHPRVLQALFSADSLGKKRNSEAIEIGPNVLVSARVLAHYPSVVRPLDEVRQEVRRDLVQTRAADMARAEGEQQLAAFRERPTEVKLGGQGVVSRNEPQGLPQAALDAAMRADPAKLPALVGVDLGAQGYVLMRVQSVQPREAASPAQTQQAQAQYLQLWTRAQTQAYLQALRERLGAKVLVSNTSLDKPANP